MCSELHIDGKRIAGVGHLARLVGRRAIRPHMDADRTGYGWNDCFCAVDLQALGLSLGFIVRPDSVDTGSCDWLTDDLPIPAPAEVEAQVEGQP